jgi:hypothetical protein
MKSLRSLLQTAGACALVAGAAACADAKDGASRADVVGTSSDKTALARAEQRGKIVSAAAEVAPGVSMSPIQLGETVRGDLSASDQTLGDGSYVDTWVLTLDEATDVRIALQSTDFDAYLALNQGRNGVAGPTITSDDDSGGGFNSLIVTSLPAGDYSILANSYDGGATGAYTLSVLGAGGGAGGDGAVPLAILPGETRVGELDGGDPTFSDGSHYDVWTFQGVAGQEVTVEMTSSEVDAYLLLYHGSPESGEYVAEDDDGADGTDSRITAVLPTSGTYSIVANSYGGGEMGSYSLSFSAAEREGVTFGGGGPENGRYALLVGIDDYPGSGNDLRGPVRDAEIMRDVLLDRYGFDEDKIVMLTDSDATRDNIANGIVQHLGQAGPDGLAVFFYSGHGTQVGANIGLTGVLDPEPRGDGDEALYIYGYDRDSSLLLDEEIGYLVESLPAGRALVAVDACFSGEITRGPGTSPQAKIVDMDDEDVAGTMSVPTEFIGDDPKIAAALEDLSIGFGDLASFDEVFSNPRRHVMWGSSTEDQVSWTSGLGGGASVFTYYLGERLSAAPGSATLMEVHEQVAADVEAYINDNGNMTMQNAQMRGQNAGMTIEEFFRQR